MDKYPIPVVYAWGKGGEIIIRDTRDQKEFTIKFVPGRLRKIDEQSRD